MEFPDILRLRVEAYKITFAALPAGIGRWPRFLAGVCAMLVSDKTVFHAVLRGVFADRVLADLRRFCRANDTTFTPGDPYTTSLLEGRRETWNHIIGLVHIDESTIHHLSED